MKYLQILFYMFCFFIYHPVVMGEGNLDNKVVGRVVNKQGDPLSGVAIRRYFNGTSSGMTDEKGMFFLTIDLKEFNNPESCCAVVFSLSGYKQMTKVFKYGENEIIVTMLPGENIWSPPICDSVSAKSNRLGWDLKVLMPKKAEVKKFIDFDNVRIHLGFKSKSEYQWMELGTGIFWLAAIPYKSLSLSHDIEERVIKDGEKGYYYEYINNNDSIRGVREHIGIDYRGIDEHGKKWREVGLRFQTITYKNATSEAAEYFDKIIDSMCVDPERVINGKVRRLSGIPDSWK